MAVRFQDNGRGGPLPERCVKAPSVENEGDPAVHELPADRGAVGAPEIEVQYTRRDVGIGGELERLVDPGRGHDGGSCILKTPRDFKAHQGLVLDDQYGLSC